MDKLVEEVGLKRMWMVQMGISKLPSTLAEMRVELQKYTTPLRTDYEGTVREYALEAVRDYGKLVKWNRGVVSKEEKLRGNHLLQYGLPPAVYYLWLKLKQ